MISSKFSNKYCGLKSTVFEDPEKFVSQISGTQEMLSAFLRELSGVVIHLQTEVCSILTIFDKF